jgi:hypothetical protein
MKIGFKKETVSVLNMTLVVLEVNIFSWYDRIVKDTYDSDVIIDI